MTEAYYTVAVLVQPIEKEGRIGLLSVIRNLPPIGGYALPGGYVEPNESNEAAAVREMWEEAGIRQSANNVTYMHEVLLPIKPNEALPICLKFYQATPLPYEVVNTGFTSPETLGIDCLFYDDAARMMQTEDGTSVTLCFPTHQEAAVKYFQQYKHD